MVKKLSKYFVNGLITLVPLALTVSIIISLVNFADHLVGRYFHVLIPGTGLLFTLLFILFMGWLSTNWFTRRLVEWSEWVIIHIPIVKTIYSSIKQMSAAVFDSRKLLQQAVLVPFPDKETRALGFIMGDVAGPMADGFTEEQVCVFVPISLNLTGGFNIIVPKKDVIRLNITSESALQYVLTAGAIMPKAYPQCIPDGAAVIPDGRLPKQGEMSS